MSYKAEIKNEQRRGNKVKTETVWLAPKEYADKYGTDLMVLCKFLQIDTAEGLCLQYNIGSYTGAVENEASANKQLEAKGFICLGEL